MTVYTVYTVPKHSTEEYDIAISAAKFLKQRDGSISSRALIGELEKRTGKPAGYWHIIELINVIKADSDASRKKAKRYKLSKEQEIEIITAAAEIAYKKSIPTVTAQEIREYFRDKFRELKAEDKPAGSAALTRATAEKFNQILKAAGFTQYKTAGYITSIPPARNAADMESATLKILEAAQDPESGIGDKLKDIRYRHKFRDATAEELQAALLADFLAGDIGDNIGKYELETLKKEAINAKNTGTDPATHNSLLPALITPENIELVLSAKAKRDQDRKQNKD